jgi:hypothetical protein
VASREFTVGDRPLDTSGELKQSQGIGDRNPAFADPCGHIIMRKLKLVDQLLVGSRRLKGVEISPVEVVHQGLLKAALVRRVDPHQHRDGRQAGSASRPPAALPGDELEGVSLVAHWAHQDRLEDTQFTNGGRK